MLHNNLDGDSRKTKLLQIKIGVCSMKSQKQLHERVALALALRFVLFLL